MVKDVAEVSIVQKSVRKEQLAKVFSARGTIMYAVFGISAVILGWITEEYGVTITFLLAAGFFLLSFLVGIANRKHLLVKQKS